MFSNRKLSLIILVLAYFDKIKSVDIIFSPREFIAKQAILQSNINIVWVDGNRKCKCK